MPYNRGANSGLDSDNVGFQFTRHTFDNGNHQHNVNGPTWINYAQISYTGGNQPIDIRNAYTVVQYIIYIKN